MNVANALLLKLISAAGASDGGRCCYRSWECTRICLATFCCVCPPYNSHQIMILICRTVVDPNRDLGVTLESTVLVAFELVKSVYLIRTFLPDLDLDC